MDYVRGRIGICEEHPEMDWETVHDRFSDEADAVYQTLADAVHEGKPIADSLQTVLLHARDDSERAAGGR